MTTPESFEATLKDVVRAERLSASKMTTLTDIALKCMKDDTQLVSIMFRTHKTLSPTAKISSLYAFDALSRAARNQVTKHGIKVDSASNQGNCATFLLKIEGVLDSLFQDLVASGHGELKEKAKKILGIWVKSNTFPSAVLGRLSQFLKDAEKASDKVITAPSVDPRNQPTSTTPPSVAISAPASQPPASAIDQNAVQSTLFALLSQAANAVAANNSQTPTNTATSPPPAGSAAAPVLDANQLALFQQLTQTVKLGNSVPTQPVPLPVSLVQSSTSATNPVSVVPPDRGPSQPPAPYRDDQRGPGHREPNHDRYGGPMRPRDRDDYYDDRRDTRGGFRDGARGRGRGNGRWDDRERYNDRSRDRERSPPRGRRSRSPSPPGRHGGPRDARKYDTRRPYVPQEPRDKPAINPSGSPSANKDEFGRDIRIGSPDTARAGSTSSRTNAGDQSPSLTRSTLSDSNSPAPQTIPVHVQPQSSNQFASATPSGGGLDAFDMSTFDPTSPDWWDALGKAWVITRGSAPSQTELMQYAFSGGLMPVASQMPAQQTHEQWPRNGNEYGGGHSQQPYRGGWRGGRAGRGRGRGRGGDYYGNGRSAGYQGGSYEEQTLIADADGMEGGAGYGAPSEWEVQGSNGGDHDTAHAGLDATLNPASGSGVGKMQRVGDKWVFVRN